MWCLSLLDHIYELDDETELEIAPEYLDLRLDLKGIRFKLLDWVALAKSGQWPSEEQIQKDCKGSASFVFAGIPDGNGDIKVTAVCGGWIQKAI